MGVLAVDYRTLDAGTPKKFPLALDDVVDAFVWLSSYGPSSLHLCEHDATLLRIVAPCGKSVKPVPCATDGDSSGGTQAVQLLVWMAHHQMQGKDFGFVIKSAVVFSAWLDLTASSPTYHSRTHCGGACDGIGDATTIMDPGSSRLHGMCAAMGYAGNLPTNHPTISPLSAPGYLLGRLPPLMRTSLHFCVRFVCDFLKQC
eukprot:SAG31_NODE_257_length_18942_cov_6.099135_11_plen_201_part_00